MALKGVSHTLSYRCVSVFILVMLTLSRMSELTKETVLDLDHHVDFLLAAEEFGPHFPVTLRRLWIESEKYLSTPCGHLHEGEGVYTIKCAIF